MEQNLSYFSKSIENMRRLVVGMNGGVEGITPNDYQAVNTIGESRANVAAVPLANIKEKE